MTQPQSMLRAPLTWGLLAMLGGFFLASCFQPTSQACKTGLVCPSGSVCSEDGKTCIRSQCGNSQVNASDREVCDDGNTLSGDGCRSDCLSDEKCGTGAVDPDLGEVCDDGNNTSGDGCSLDCKSKETCGNGYLDTARGEVCDDRNTTDGDGCSADCRSKEICGNGVVDDKFPNVARNEACDDGNLVAGDGCSPECMAEGCGNGVVDFAFGEVCDDGNTRSGDGCRNDCRSNETCGNSAVDTARGEKCDDGNVVAGDGCSADCLSTEICGNAYRDGTRGEVCDDGNADGGDGCSFDCRSTEVCGNAYVDAIRLEVCDDGNLDGGDGCSFDCRSTEVCGNAYRDAIKGEVCDDGNNNPGDGCASDCRSTEVCGNTIVDVPVGEVCDDGNTTDGPADGGDGCSANCRSNQSCGNGTLDLVRAEVCDDGNTNSGDGCRNDCRSNERCGNGILDNQVGEVCDDGNTSNTFPDGGLDTCAADCRSGLGCGNGIRDPGEECDDGNTDDLDNCRNNCTFGVCGDGVVDLQLPRVEQCDTSGESLTCNTNCTNAYCGDAIVNVTRSEQCDVANTDGGTDGGAETAACDTDCTVAFCGDSTHNATRGEQCDTGGNSLTCNANCTSAVCGDRYLNPAAGEQCDTGVDTPLCDDDCTPVQCGDSHPNTDAGEQCDDGNGSNADHCVQNCRLARCGDSYQDLLGPPVEACDDGNTVTEAACSYGTATCSVCRNDCLALVARTGAYCGDNLTNGTAPDGGVIETCDDGNAVTESECPYGQTPCTRCSGNCLTVLGLTGPKCGDGISNGPLPDGGLFEPCDDGNTVTEASCPYGISNCSVCDNTCSALVARTGPFCGDTIVNGLKPDGGVLEKCDEGDTVTETTCAYGQSSCTRCDGQCLTILSLAGPYCGDGTANGPLPDGGSFEPCDDGNAVTEATCPYGTPSCNVCDDTCSNLVARTGPYCGDSATNGVKPDGGVLEKCDDGNAVTEAACAYGVASCSACDSNCQTILALTGPRCGDNVVNGPLPDGGATEVCDDGNTSTETACPYGQATCTRCDATCDTVLNLTGPFCGDGVVTSPEACDDGNNLTCGGCNATCTAIQIPVAATGTITTIKTNDFTDGETFSLGDGVNPVVVFELDKDAVLSDGGFAITAGNARVDLTGASNTTSAAGDRIVAAINDFDGGLAITATKFGTQPHVRLANEEVGGFGNVPITDTVGPGGFTHAGMGGGGGFDCGADAGCTADSDCALPNLCQGLDAGAVGHCLP